MERQQEVRTALLAYCKMKRQQEERTACEKMERQKRTKAALLAKDRKAT
jgi:hypothetical protein